RAGRHAVVRREVATAGARRARRLHPKPGTGGPVMFKIEYATQRLALPFFVLMGVLFLIQAGFGFLLALQHNDPALLQGSINFNVARAAHLNLAVLWIIAGFVGTLLWTLPLLSKKEVGSPAIARLLFFALIVVVAWNVSTLWLAQEGSAGWWG